MVNISKNQLNLSKSGTANTNLRLTRSRSKDETFSSCKSPDFFSDDDNISGRVELRVFSGNNSSNLRIRNRNPSFEHEKSEWSNHGVE